MAAEAGMKLAPSREEGEEAAAKQPKMRSEARKLRTPKQSTEEAANG